MRDPYEILGVTPQSDDAAIKQAFHKLAKEHHPDRNGGSDEATARFQEIQGAYEQVKTQEKRAEFERFGGGNGGFRPSPGFGGFHFRQDGNVDIDQILREFHRQQSQPRNRNYSTQCGITLADAFRGCEVSLKLDSREIRVKIPAGVDNGTRIRVGGAGENVHANLPPGDLFVTIFVESDSRFARNGKHLFSDVQMSVFDAILGGIVTVPTIDGVNLDVQIRPGVQQDHQVSLAGKGMPMINSDQRGDHIITVKLLIPTDLTEEQINLVKQIKDLPN